VSKDETELYRENVGRDPETRFPDDPDWEYRGTKAEREELAERIREEAVIEGQEALFNE
jgi:hypothetical protein